MIKSRKYLLIVLLCALTMLVLFSACGQDEQGAATQLAGDYTDYSGGGKIIAVQAGDIYESFVQKEAWCESPLIYPSITEMAEAVRQGRADAAMITEDAVAALVESGAYDGLEYLPVPREVMEIKSAPVFHTQELAEQFNAFLVEVQASGILDEIYQRYFYGLPNEADIPKIELSGENGTLKVADTGTYPPMSYLGTDGQVFGYGIELAQRFAQYLGMDLQIELMNYDGVLPSVVSGHADMSACFYVITEDRTENAIFSDAIMRLGSVLAVRRTEDNTAADSGSSEATGPRYAEFIDTGKHFGTISGDVYGNTVGEDFGAGAVSEYRTIADGIIALRNSRIDVFVADRVDLWQTEQTNEYDDIEFLTIPLDVYLVEHAPIFATAELCNTFDDFLAELKADGSIDAMHAFWFNEAGLPADDTIPRYELTGENGTLRCTMDSGSAPQSYRDANGEYVGFAVELFCRFAQQLGMDIEWIDCDMLTSLSYLESGRSDIYASMSTKIEGLLGKLHYGATVLDDPAILVVRSNTTGTTSRDYIWFSGKKVGASVGTINDSLLRTFGAEPVLYQDIATAVEDVRKGRISGYSADYSTLQIVAREPENEGMEVIAVPKSIFVGPMGAIASFENQALIDEFNAFLALLRADGTFDEIQQRWFNPSTDLNAPMPELSYSGEKGVLRVATEGIVMPFDYIGADNELKGYTIELMNRFAAHAGYTLEYSCMEFSGIIAAVAGGRVDMAISCISITAERQESVLFTDPIYEDQCGIIALKDGLAVPGSNQEAFSLIAWLKDAVERNLLVENRWKMVVDGLGVTMTISLLAQFLGTVLGCLLCFMLTRKHLLVNGIGRVYSGFIHGLPIVVLLMISYYIIFGKTDVSAIMIAVCAFAVVEAAGIASTLKGAIDTVDVTEIEAARSMGFSARGAFRTVTLPQMIKKAFPAYCNGFIELVKATAIVGYIAIQDLTRAGDIIRSRTYDAFFPLLMVAIIYLIVTTVCVQLFKWIVRKLNKEV